MTTQTPLKYRITHQYDGMDISETEFSRLLDIASWNGARPNFVRRGRGSWETLMSDVSLKNNPDTRFYAAKLKGVGLWNPKSDDDGAYSNLLHKDSGQEPVPPLTDLLEYLVTYPHFGISNGAEYQYAYSSASPIGGIVHERAHREFWAAQRLVEHSVPTIAPLAVIEYDETLQFQGEPMGAVITLAPGLAPYRISEVLFGAAMERGSDPGFDQHYDEMRKCLNIDGDPDDERVRLAVICALAKEAGKLIHDFSLTGMFRYSGDWGNFVYSTEEKQLFLIDLDSVQDISVLPGPAQAMQVWRDIVSTAYRMVGKIGYPTALGKYTINNLLEFDPIAALLSGYFVNVPEAELRAASRRLWGYFIPHLSLLNKHKETILRPETGDGRKDYKMDHDLFYILGMTILQPFFARSEIGEKYPNDITPDDMWQKAEAFLGDRFEYFAYLMGEPGKVL